jgi:hypothetical protein
MARFHHETPYVVHQKFMGDMSYIRHKTGIDTGIAPAYTFLFDLPERKTLLEQVVTSQVFTGIIMGLLNILLFCFAWFRRRFHHLSGDSS